MRSHPDPAVQNLHGVGRQVYVHFLMHQRVRHAVEVALHFDVIVDVSCGQTHKICSVASAVLWRWSRFSAT
jgi:hypothetical protein